MNTALKTGAALFAALFPVWVIVAVIAGMTLPVIFSSISGWVVPLLTAIMVCMGLTLKVSDFTKTAQNKSAIALGLGLQFALMPAIAFGISHTLSLSLELTIGMLLVGSVAGGTSSNVMTLLAKGDLALSVSMTAFSTLMSIVLTPFLLSLWLGVSVDVPVASMLTSLVQIILIPVGLGILINGLFSERVEAVSFALAPIAVLLIVLIIAIVVALNADRIQTGALSIAIATLAHNSLGLAAGYFGARLLGYNSVIARTISIEVGMQNSGLATVLALKFFSPIAALPGAIFSIWLNITGSVLAFMFTRQERLAKPIS